MRLKEALDIKRGEVISLVGGGDKTTLMFALARELSTAGSFSITTTTTKIYEPLPSQTPFLLLEAEEEKMIESLIQSLDKYRHITLARERLPSGKLAGISPDLVGRLARINRVSYIIVEADGATQRPLKAPGPTEPVIPSNTSLLIPIVGIDAVDCRLTEENVFRPQIVYKLIKVPLGEVISTESIAFLVTHEQGIIKGSPDSARIIPFINKVDLDKGLVKARDLASKILAIRHPRVKQVVLGQAQLTEPVIEVISLEAG